MPFTTAQVQQAYVTFFSRAADTAGLNYWTQIASSNLADLYNAFSGSAEYTSAFNGLSNGARVDLVYKNLFGRSADTAGLNYWTLQLDRGAVTLANLALSLGAGSQGTDTTTLANRVTAATAYTSALDTNAKILGYSGTAANAAVKTWLSGITDAASLTAATAAPALASTVTSTIAAGASAAAAGSVFALTTATNNFTGTSGDDSFDAGLNSSSQQTLNSGDRLAGGAGADSLFATINASVTPASITGIEDVTVTVVTNSATVDFTNSTGISTVNSQASTGVGNVVTLAGLSKSVGVSIKDTSMAHTITYSDVSGSTDSATVNISNMSQATGVVTSILGVETLTLNAVGSASSSSTTGIGTLTATQTTKLNVTGDKALNIVDALGTTIITVDASNTSAGVNMDFGGSNMTVTGGSGNDDFTFTAAGDVLVVGGGLNDTFTFGSTYTTADTVDAGDGNDTLSAEAASLVTASATTPTTYRTTSIEKLSLSTAIADTATVNAANISTSINRIELKLGTAATNGTETYIFNAGASTLELDAAISVGAGGTQAMSVGGSATTDTLTIINGTTSATDVLAGLALTTTGFETVTINTTGTGAAGAQTVGAIDITATGTATPTLVVTGSNALTTGVITMAGTLDATGTTGSTGVTMVAGTNTITKALGGTGADTFFGNNAVTTKLTVDGGAGNDSITSHAGADSILGGDGADSIQSGSGNDFINAGAGNDTYNIATAGDLQTGDTIIGGDGTDKLKLSSIATDSAAVFQSVSGFEVLEMSEAGTGTVTMSNFINNQTFTRVDFGDVGGGGTATVNNAADAVTNVRLLAGLEADNAVFDRLIDGPANSVTLENFAGVAISVTALTLADEETITYTSDTAASDMIVTTLNAADLKTLFVTGAGDITIGTLSSTLLATLDASGSSGVVSVSNTSNVVAANVTAGTGALTYTGGLLADTITGGIAADVLNGAAGADIINAGAGSDTITGGTGADVINVGSGTERLTYTVGDTATGATAAGAVTSLALTGADVITGMGTSDVISFTATGYTGVGNAATGIFQTALLTTATLTENTGNAIRGSWAADTTTGSGTFIVNSSGADTLLIWDANDVAATYAAQAVVLVGVTGVTAAATEPVDNSTIVITLTVA